MARHVPRCARKCTIDKMKRGLVDVLILVLNPWRHAYWLILEKGQRPLSSQLAAVVKATRWISQRLVWFAFISCGQMICLLEMVICRSIGGGQPCQSVIIESITATIHHAAESRLWNANNGTALATALKAWYATWTQLGP